MRLWVLDYADIAVGVYYAQGVRIDMQANGCAHFDLAFEKDVYVSYARRCGNSAFRKFFGTVVEYFDDSRGNALVGEIRVVRREIVGQIDREYLSARSGDELLAYAVGGTEFNAVDIEQIVKDLLARFLLVEFTG